MRQGQTMSLPPELDSLVNTLADGFDSLLLEVQRLSHRQQDLEQRLKDASEVRRMRSL